MKTREEEVRQERIANSREPSISGRCRRDKAKFQQAVGSDKTYDFISEEVRSVAKSAKPADTKWARKQGEILGLKLDSPGK